MKTSPINLPVAVGCPAFSEFGGGAPASFVARSGEASRGLTPVPALSSIELSARMSRAGARKQTGPKHKPTGAQLGGAAGSNA